VRVESTGDNAYPSGTSAAIDLLLDLTESSGDARYAAAAGRVLARYGARVAKLPSMWASTVAAVNAHDVMSDVLRTGDVVAAADPYRGPLQSADRVRVSAQATRTPNEAITVLLSIDKGFHVNANPASFDFLIPTSAAFEAVDAQHIEYPEPQELAVDFADGKPLSVYSGEVTIVATFPRGTFARQSQIEGSVTAQACNHEMCLPPSKFPVSLEVSAHARPDATPKDAVKAP
jgi:hypothetical protein